MPPTSSLSLTSTLQAPPLNHHAQLSKLSIHFLSRPHPLSPTSPAAGLTISVTEAVNLSNVFSDAAIDALQLAYMLTVAGPSQSSCGHGVEWHRNSLRERRRRRRRSGVLDVGEENDCGWRGLGGRCLSKAERSRYLTRAQEAELSSYLKIDAMVEDSLGRETTACASRMGMRRRNERAMLRTRECRERIYLSYKMLVVSVAASYQGKGLSLQDLIQDIIQGPEERRPENMVNRQELLQKLNLLLKTLCERQEIS